MITRRGIVAAGAAVPLLARAAAAVAATPPSIAELVREPTLRGAALSPNGQWIAIAGEVRQGETRAAHIDLIDAADPDAPRRRVPVGDSDVSGVAWANDERLLIWLVRDLTSIESARARDIGINFELRVRRLMSITVDGGDPVVMFGDQPRLGRTNYDLGYVVDMLPNDPRRILMRAADVQSGRFHLHRVDVYTGQSEVLDYGGPQTWDWEIQDGAPVLRWDLNDRGTIASIFGRDEAGGWRPVRKVIRRTEFLRPDFDVLGPAAEAGVFLVASRGEADPAAAIRPFDFKRGEFGEPLSMRADRDVDGAVFDQQGRYLAARYVEDRVVYDFADPALGAHFRGIDSFFEQECNVYVLDVNRKHSRFVLLVTGPRLPGAYYYYDSEARRLQNLGEHKPWLTVDRLAKVEPHDVNTRDGATLRAYLTVPLAAGKRPLVVMPHGGPEVRDAMEYDLFAQAFAARGWLVLQPNFRGSGGYGRAFADAGRKRWGDRMQEDVEDAVAQVLASGRADPKRVAIWGASYGAYAALMGAARRPDLYRCAVGVAGVFDLPQMMKDESAEGLDSPVYEYWTRTVGDPRTESALLEAASPSRRAADIAAPVLLIHGLKDKVALPNQSRIMASALKAAKKPHEHVELRSVGHSGWDKETYQKVLETSVAFIAKAFA